MMTRGPNCCPKLPSDSLFTPIHERQFVITVNCRYNAVQYSKILHKKLQQLRQNINQMLHPQKTPHTHNGRTMVCLL